VLGDPKGGIGWSITSGRTAGEVVAAPAITGRIEGLAGVGLIEPRGVRAVCP